MASLCPRVLVDSPDPRLEPRIRAVEREVLDEDPVERLRVFRIDDHAVLEELEERAVDDAELVAQHVRTVGEQRLEAVARALQLLDLRADALLDPLLHRERALELVRRLLPDAVEPVDQQHCFGTAGLVARIQRRVRVALLQVLEDRGRVGDELPVVLEHRHEWLAARLDYRGAVVAVDVDPLRLEPFVPERQGDPLDVRRERDAPDADHAPFCASSCRGSTGSPARSGWSSKPYRTIARFA